MTYVICPAYNKDERILTIVAISDGGGVGYDLLDVFPYRPINDPHLIYITGPTMGWCELLSSAKRLFGSRNLLRGATMDYDAMRLLELVDMEMMWVDSPHDLCLMMGIRHMYARILFDMDYNGVATAKAADIAAKRLVEEGFDSMLETIGVHGIQEEDWL